MQYVFGFFQINPLSFVLLHVVVNALFFYEFRLFCTSEEEIIFISFRLNIFRLFFPISTFLPGY